MKNIILGFIFFIGLGLATISHAQMIEGSLPANDVEINEADAKAIGLSAQQITQIQTTKETHQEKSFEFRKQMMDKTQQLREETAAKEPNKGKIKSLAQEINELEKKIADDHIEYYFALRNMLNDKQRAALIELRGEESTKMRAEMEKRIKEMRANIPLPPNQKDDAPNVTPKGAKKPPQQKPVKP